MRTYTIKIDIKADGRITVLCIESGKDPEWVVLPNGKDKLSLSADDKTICTLINILRDNRLRGEQEYELLGSFLYKALLDNEIGSRLHRWRKDPDVEAINVELSFTGNDNPYASWPWEYMFCRAGTYNGNAGYFVAADKKIIITRPVDQPLGDATYPLRILLVAPGPSAAMQGDADRVKKQFGLDLLSYEKMFTAIEEIVKPHSNIIELEKVVAAEKESELDGSKIYVLTAETFGDKVEKIQPHVIHFFGHGRMTKNKGQLAFTNQYGRHDWVDEDTFAEKVKLSANIRFVFLQACESAAVAPHEAISGVARQLVSASVPAVVAMQCKINQRSALGFTEVFYRELANTGTIDAAVQEGRRFIYDNKIPTGFLDEEERDFAFGIPVLYIKDRKPLFVKPAEGKKGKDQKSDQHETFYCYKCDKEKLRPLRLDAKFCEHCGSAFVERPNPNCTEKGCPRKLLSSHHFCPECGLQNKDLSHQKTAQGV